MVYGDFSRGREKGGEFVVLRVGVVVGREGGFVKVRLRNVLITRRKFK